MCALICGFLLLSHLIQSFRILQNFWSWRHSLLFPTEMNTKNFFLLLFLGMVQKGKSIASALSAILNLKLPNFIKEWFLTWPSIAVLHSIVIRNIFFLQSNCSWVSISILLLMSYVTLTMLLKISVPQFLHLITSKYYLIYFRELLWRFSELLVFCKSSINVSR